MNKYIIFALLFVFVLNADYDDFINLGADSVDCYKLTENDASVDKCSAVKLNNGDYSCCYVEEKILSMKTIKCSAVKKKDVKSYVKDYNKAGDDNAEISIDCSSNYISNALLILLSLLL